MGNGLGQPENAVCGVQTALGCFFTSLKLALPVFRLPRVGRILESDVCPQGKICFRLPYSRLGRLVEYEYPTYGFQTAFYVSGCLCVSVGSRPNLRLLFVVERCNAAVFLHDDDGQVGGVERGEFVQTVVAACVYQAADGLGKLFVHGCAAFLVCAVFRLL